MAKSVTMVDGGEAAIAVREGKVSDPDVSDAREAARQTWQYCETQIPEHEFRTTPEEGGLVACLDAWHIGQGRSPRGLDDFRDELNRRATERHRRTGTFRPDRSSPWHQGIRVNS